MTFFHQGESHVLDTNLRDLEGDMLRRIHAHGLIIPAPFTILCLSIFSAFHHWSFVCKRIATENT